MLKMKQTVVSAAATSIRNLLHRLLFAMIIEMSLLEDRVWSDDFDGR